MLLGYLGYPGSTGLAQFTARITDRQADPFTEPELAGPEALVHIEQGYLAYTPPGDAPAVSPLPAASARALVFGCFNDALKLNHAVLETWAELLRACEGSRLLLKTRALAWTDVQRRVLQPLAAGGIARERIELLPATATRREHLETYA